MIHFYTRLTNAYLRRGAQLAAHKYADAMVRQPDYFPDKSKKSLPVFLVTTAIHSDNFIEIHRKLSDITPTVQSGEGIRGLAGRARSEL